jgi:AcrR family transcriptional regulator
MSQQRSRFLALSADQKKRFLDIAESEFTQNSFEKASMNKILTKAQMSKGQAYYYITGKDELYVHVCERAFSPLAASIQIDSNIITTADQFWIWLAQSFQKTTAFFQEHPHLAALGRGAYQSAAALSALATSQQKLLNKAHDIVAHGQQLGAIRNDLPTDLLASILFATLREVDRGFALQSDDSDLSSVSEMESKLIHLLRSAMHGD